MDGRDQFGVRDFGVRGVFFRKCVKRSFICINVMLKEMFRLQLTFHLTVHDDQGYDITVAESRNAYNMKS